MELRQLTYAVAVAHAGSFSRAAAELHLSQPSLSAAIAQLETELDVRIFVRSSRGIDLTPTGAYLVRQAQRLLRDVDEMRGTVRAMATGNTGSLNLAIVPVLAWELVPPLLRTFRTAYPGIEVGVRERTATEVIELLLEGSVDVGIVATASTSHLREFHRDTLVVEHLGTVDLIAALPDRFEGSPDPIHLADLSDEQIALPPPSARTFGLHAGMLRAFDRANLPQPRIRVVPSLAEGIPLAMAGIAVAMVPEGMREAITSPALVIRRIADGPEPLHVSLLHRPGPGASASVRRFAKVARDVRGIKSQRRGITSKS